MAKAIHDYITKMKKEDLIHALHTHRRMSMREAGEVMDAIFEERERLFRNRDLEVKTSPIHGRGVFATQDIPAGAILEECHFIQLNETDFDNLDPGLKHYVFLFPRGFKGKGRAYAIPLGICSIINHSHDHPNATWTTSESRWLFIFTSLRHIQAGEEILIDYDRG
ncbi:MAG: SET domain-containing protein-lysine N-methyltransferase [Deltaproteobacteria bacterium]|nr:SET domain-containing protein-lysine N-methyltransferase [Deltaproteobacteria bacterium]